jgi:hypothetical protein
MGPIGREIQPAASLVDFMGTPVAASFAINRA